MRGDATAAPRARRWPSTQGCGAGRCGPGRGRSPAPARAATPAVRRRGPTPGLRPRGPGGHRAGPRGGRLGRHARRGDAAARGALLRRPGGGGAGRAAGGGADGADGAAVGAGRGDADRSGAVLRRPGAAAELPALLYRTGWDDADLDLRALGPGRTSPPHPRTSAASARSAGCGPPRWTRRPLPRRPGCCWGRWRTSATARRKPRYGGRAARSPWERPPVRRRVVRVSRRSGRPRRRPARTGRGRPGPRRGRSASPVRPARAGPR